MLNLFVGCDTKTHRLIEQIDRASRSEVAVLIQGEPGTGKHLAAWMVHRLGPHPEQPYLVLDCRTLPREAIEAELFGVEPGTHTQVKNSHGGLLEAAGNGTVVLDEITVLDLALQAKLLRAIEEKEIRRVGGNEVRPMSARIIALCSLEVSRAVTRQLIREDLFYRMTRIPLVTTPLRERPADVAILTQHFLDQFAQLQRVPRIHCAPLAMAALEQYSFPGNVRELRDILENAARNCAERRIEVNDLPSHVRSDIEASPARASLEEVERHHISKVLSITQGKKSKAALILGISRKTLLEKRKRYGLG